MNSDIQNLVNNATDKYGIDRTAFTALIISESGGQNVTNNAGYIGYGQLGKGVIDKYQVQNPYDAKQNIDASAAYLADLYKQTGSIDRAVFLYKGLQTISDNPDRQKTLMDRYYNIVDQVNLSNSAVQPDEAKTTDNGIKGLSGDKILQDLYGNDKPIGTDPNQIADTPATQTGDWLARIKTPEFIGVAVVTVILFIFAANSLINKSRQVISDGIK